MGKAWLRRRRSDPYYRRAKALGYRSRAAFKLLQIHERFDLLRPGDVVVDLGAAPGGWSQVALELVGPSGRVVAVDKIGMAPLEGVEFLRADTEKPSTITALMHLLGGRASVVLSDMSPRVSGVRATDHARAIDLAMGALAMASEILERDGRFVTKTFQGDLYRSFLRQVTSRFQFAQGFEPPATVAESREVYVVGKGFKAFRRSPRKV